MAEAPVRREFNNGHKTLNAAEAKALQELLKSEKDKRRYFEENKHKMIRARNPISGEATPREGKGEPIINPNPPDIRETRPKKHEKPLTEKIGVVTTRYDCLGNGPNRSGMNESTPVASARGEPPSARQQSKQQVRQQALEMPKHAASALKFDSFGFVIEEE